MKIKPNDKQYTAEEEKILNALREKISSQLEYNSTSIIFANGRWRAESFDRVIGDEFKKAGYYVAFDFIPSGYRSMIISKMPIGHPTGRFVSREFV